MTMMPGLKSDNVSKLGFMSIAKMIHQDGLKEIEKGNTLRFQSVEGSHQHAKYKSIIERIAKTAGKTVKHAGLLPITSAPFLRGETMLIESILVESPALGLNIDRNDSRDMMRTKIAEVEPHARKLTDTLHMHSYPGTNQHLFFHKSDVGIPHSGSLFTQNDSMMIHNMVDRVDHPNADYIHKTIQHLVDSGFEVVSDSKQSTGGRSLWTNIHKNVNFTNAAVMNSQGRSPVDNFEKFKDVDDAKTRFSIWKD
jgi:hypothetical protein